MSRRKQAKKNTVSKPKIALMVLLALVMAGVWGNALLGGKPDAPAKRKRPARSVEVRTAAGSAQNPRARTSTSTSKTNAGETQTAIVDWPDMPLADAIRNDPFAKPTWAAVAVQEPEPQAAAATAATATNPLAEATATMIVIAGSERIATIAGQEVRVGDVLDGYEVIEITPRGVVLADVPQTN